VLLSTLLSLLFIDSSESYDGFDWYTPSFLISISWPGTIGQTTEGRIEGFLGLAFGFSPWAWPQSSWWIEEPINIASVIIALLLLSATASFIIPAKWSMKSLPASRPIPLRGRITAALINGFIAAALVAGAIETAGYDVIPVLDALGWLAPVQQWGNQQTHHQSYFTYSTYERLMPTWGVWALASWLTVALIVIPVALFSLVAGAFWPIPSNRYWQTERRTLIYTFVGLAMISASTLLCDKDAENYRHSVHFLGGWFSVWLIGWWVMTWAWLSRTALFFMLRRHDLAQSDPDNPTCFACGYNLTGSLMGKQTKCPECGTPISERLLSRAVVTS
jgi:predicted RNA-binding Zn-ribbon protein involved in translation (DUF1610 family)